MAAKKKTPVVIPQSYAVPFYNYYEILKIETVLSLGTNTAIATVTRDFFAQLFNLNIAWDYASSTTDIDYLDIYINNKILWRSAIVRDETNQSTIITFPLKDVKLSKGDILKAVLDGAAATTANIKCFLGGYYTST